MTDDDLDELIHAGDLDGLVRMIDDRCSSRDWPGLLRVRDRSRAAVETGRQLWPAATLAEYRLALLADPEHVARVLDEADGLSGRFTIGPLTEVAAQNHTWSELAPFLDDGPRATFVAHERVIRGEAVELASDPADSVLELPASLQHWEPDYALATYTDNGGEFPMPDLPDDWVDIHPEPGAERLDDDVDLATRQLVEPWTVSSNGQCETVCVHGDAADALGSLGVRRARVCELRASTALAWSAWAGASGGAHGRRRGAAAGRFGAWWLLAALADRLDDWPLRESELGEFADEFRWFRWNAHEPELGWTLRLVVEDSAERVAWAINAFDHTD